MRYGIYQSINGGQTLRILSLNYIDEAIRILRDLQESAALYLRMHDDGAHYNFEMREEEQQA